MLEISRVHAEGKIRGVFSSVIAHVLALLKDITVNIRYGNRLSSFYRP